jgi:hypothetical protein
MTTRRGEQTYSEIWIVRQAHFHVYFSLLLFPHFPTLRASRAEGRHSPSPHPYSTRPLRPTRHNPVRPPIFPTLAPFEVYDGLYPLPSPHPSRATPNSPAPPSPLLTCWRAQEGSGERPGNAQPRRTRVRVCAWNATWMGGRKVKVRDPQAGQRATQQRWPGTAQPGKGGVG